MKRLTPNAAILLSLITATTLIATTTQAVEPQSRMHRNMPTFADFDLDDNGEISQVEFNEVRSERISKNAEEGRMMRNMPKAMSFEDIDKDASGGISAQEFADHQEECMNSK